MAAQRAAQFQARTTRFPLSGHKGWKTLRERLERQARALGYHQVRATQPIDGNPVFTVGELIAEGVWAPELPGETLSIVASNLSTHPKLLRFESK